MTGEVTRDDDDGTVTVRLHRHGRRDMCDLMIICWEQWHDGYVAAARAAMAEMALINAAAQAAFLRTDR